ncbi:MAG: type IX secretion system sortase PorU [Flavobacteriales bacterium]|nr:type IX secretion system sortase PorU [Flavobacteriales bacterium]
MIFSRKPNTIIIVYLFMLLSATAQSQLASRKGAVTGRADVETVEWRDPVVELKYDGSKRTYPFFEGAIFLKDDNLPYIVKNVRVSPINTIEAVLLEQNFEPLTSEEVAALAGVDIPNSIDVTTSLYTERKSTFARLAFIPIRKNPTTGALEKLVSFNWRIKEVPKADSKRTKATGFVTQSVLSSGNWYKVAVSQDGLHKITYDDLEALGMDVNSIDPSRLNVYGNGGGMLPQANSAFRFDDLQQNAIQVVGEGDGSFDQGDYILFYAKGPNSWVQDSSSCGLFRHELNAYSEKSYYFISTTAGPGRRVASIPSSSGTVTNTVTKFVDHAFHEADNHNLLKSGREWFGEEFDIQTTYSFDFGFANVTTDPGYLSVKIVSGANTPTSYTVKVNGSSILSSEGIASAPGGYNANGKVATACEQVQYSSGNTNVSVTYNKSGNASAVAWLDYLELILTRNLSMSGTQMPFRSLESVGAGNVSEFQISNANSSMRVWEVTDPTNVSERQLSLSGSTASFKVETDSLREFIAFSGGAYYNVEPIGQVANQNLHGLSQADMVIISHPNFLSEAERLANFHEQSDVNPLTVHIVTPEQIFNEFSSGAQDVTAIRDFMRMFYQRSTSWQDMTRYLLLFGDASYDYKDRLQDNTNFVPTYESVESLTPTISYASDDYYGLLDPNEGEWASSSSDALDIGIGRFVARTLEDARTVVDKIYRYEELNIDDLQTEHVCGESGSAVVSPDWRNRIVFVADDEDSNMHINQADQLAELVDTMYPEYNLTKIYLDAFLQESTPGGQRYPEVNTSFNNEVNRGNLIVNYTGHGGELGLTHERVLGLSDINSWSNADNLAAFVTATCEFARYDDPSRISAGELVHLNPNGGGIALFTTSRLVYSAPNFTLNKNFFLNLLNEQPWGPPTMGDVIRMTKVASGGSVNNRNFLLIGDPAQRLSFPLHGVETLTINNDDVNSLTDTINALQLVTVTGRMRNRNGQLMQNFNGVVYPTVFDKSTQVSTLANDPASSVRQFSVQKNLIYKGKASVTNGEFSFSFIVPRDISYNYGFGRISYYAEGNNTNGNGYFERFVIGGSSDSAAVDEVGPLVSLYMNDDDFAFGGTTDENPSLLAIVSDTNGINTVGNGIGHDITAVLDDNTNSTINLNDFYQADLDSYKSGKVVYPFSDLSEGTHNIRFKIWDVYNNSSEAYTEFVVAESANLALDHVLNYPNPFTTRTEFMFEHNQPCNSLDVQVQIFTVSGKLVKTINETVLSHGFRNEPIAWDGLDDYGQKIGRGVYLYNLKITTPDGQKAEQIERLVILN